MENQGGDEFNTAKAIVNDHDTSPKITNVTAIASGSRFNYGIQNDGASASPTITNATVITTGGIYGDAASQSYGVVNSGTSTPIMTNVTITSRGASYANVAVVDNGSVSIIRNMSINLGGPGVCNGVWSYAGSVTEMSDVTISAEGGNCYHSNGIVTGDSAIVKVDHSIIKDVTLTISNGNGSTYIAATKLDGGVATNYGGQLVCVGAYNGEYVALNTSCQ